VLRVFLFCIPTQFVSALGFGLVALFTYGWMHFRKACRYLITPSRGSMSNMAMLRQRLEFCIGHA